MIVTIYHEGELERDVEVYCNCGAKLDVVNAEEHRGKIIVTVDPCDSCTEKAYNDGYEAGIKEEVK